MGVYHFSVFREQSQETQMIIAVHIKRMSIEGKHNPAQIIS